MSNHISGRILNKVLHLFEREQVFEMLGKPKSQALVLEILELTCHYYDCNEYEILDDIGIRLGFCQKCYCSPEGLQDGVCERCRRDEVTGEANPFGLPVPGS